MRELANALYLRVNTREPEPAVVEPDPPKQSGPENPVKPKQPEQPVKPRPPRAFVRIFLPADDKGGYHYISGFENPGVTGYFKDSSSPSSSLSSISVEELIRDDDQVVVAVTSEDGVAFPVGGHDDKLKSALRSHVKSQSPPVDGGRRQTDATLDDRVRNLCVDLEVFLLDLEDGKYADVVEELDKLEKFHNLGGIVGAVQKALDIALNNIASDIAIPTIPESGRTENDDPRGSLASTPSSPVNDQTDIDVLEENLDEWRRAFDLALVSISIEAFDPTGEIMIFLDKVERPNENVGFLDNFSEDRIKRMNDALRNHYLQETRERIQKSRRSFEELVKKIDEILAARQVSDVDQNPSGTTGGNGVKKSGRATETGQKRQTVAIDDLSVPRNDNLLRDTREGKNASGSDDEEYTPSDLDEEPDGEVENEPAEAAELAEAAKEEELAEAAGLAEAAELAERLAEDAEEQERMEKNAEWEAASKQLREEIETYFHLFDEGEISNVEGDQEGRFEKTRKELNDFVENTMDTEHFEWKSTHGHKIGHDEMLGNIRVKFDAMIGNWPESKAKEVEEKGTDRMFSVKSGGGWSAVHAVASGLDSAFGLVGSGNERASGPVSSGPDSDLVWLNM